MSCASFVLLLLLLVDLSHQSLPALLWAIASGSRGGVMVSTEIRRPDLARVEADPPLFARCWSHVSRFSRFSRCGRHVGKLERGMGPTTAVG